MTSPIVTEPTPAVADRLDESTDGRSAVSDAVERGPRAARTSAPRPAGRQASLFRVVWRWHFYAGVVVTPVLVIMSVTGGLYVFRSEIEGLANGHLTSVVPQGERIPYRAQFGAAVAAFPEMRPMSVQIPAEPDKATVVTLQERKRPSDGSTGGRRTRGDSVNVYIDPYSGTVIGNLHSAEDAVGPFFNAVLSIHRTLFLGTTGRVMTELCTGWTVLLLATGLYLWWPRNRNSKGVWTPRWRAKRYTLLRDLHSVAGMYLLPITGVIAVTGMFYTLVVGKVIHDAAHYSVGETGEGRGGDRRDRGRQRSAEPEPVPFATGPSLDQVVANVRKAYPDRSIWVSLSSRRGGDLRVSAGNDFNNTWGPYVSTDFTLDKQEGRITGQKHLSEGEFFWHGWTYPLHVGSVMGIWSKVLWFAACIVLTALPITGLWMWWQRRPRGRSGLPRRPDAQLPRWLIALVGLLCVLMPVVGASVLLFAAIDGGSRLIRRRFA